MGCKKVCGSRHYWAMEKIDKLQFPLPYAQIVKILVIIYIFAFPLVISAAGSGILTIPVTFAGTMISDRMRNIYFKHFSKYTFLRVPGESLLLWFKGALRDLNSSHAQECVRKGFCVVQQYTLVLSVEVGGQRRGLAEEAFAYPSSVA